MRRFLTATVLAITFCALASCSSRKALGDYNADNGPFDANGNYIEAWADGRTSKPKREKSSRDRIAEWEKKELAQTPSPTPSSQKTTRVSQPKPAPVKKSSPKVVKPKVVKPKRKPPILYTVKKGDTLYGLALRYKTKVTLIQQLNGISGSIIRIGQKLKIPRS